MTAWDEAVFTRYCQEIKIDDMAALCYRKEIVASLGYQRFALGCAVDQLKKDIREAFRRSFGWILRRR